MADKLQAELDDFIRWLATMPHHLSDFKHDPEAVMRYAKLSDMACSTLRSTGKQGVVQQVRDKLDEMLSSEEAQKQSTFNRDRSVQGYGGAVIKKEPRDEA